MTAETSASSWPFRGGDMGERTRRHDWASSALGPVETWPQSLRTTVEILLESRHGMMLAWGRDLTLFYNDAYAPFLGLKHPAALGQPFRQAWSDVWDDIEPLVAQAMSGEAVRFEDYHLVMERHGHPEDTWWSFTYSPVRDETGAVVGMLNVTMETTGKVLALREAALERDRQRLMLQQMPGFAGVMTGPEHRYAYVNDAYVEISGGREFVGRPVREVFPEVEGQGYFERLDHVYATGERFEARATPIRLERADGERFIDLLFEPVRDENGGVIGIFVGGYDITDRVRADRALRESELRLRELNETLERRVAEALAERKVFADVVGGTDAFVQVVAPDFRWLAINKASAEEFERIYGKRPQPGDNMLDLLADQPEHRAAVEAIWSRALSGEEFIEVAEFGDPARDRRAYEMKFNTLRGPDGRPIGAYQFVHDVTERIEAQERLAQTEEALRQAQKMEAVGQLTGGLAHDFNNLLAGISGSLELMQMRIAQGRVAELEKYVVAAQGAAKRAASLTHRLLAFSRRQTLDPKPTDVNRLVRDMEDLIRRTVGPSIRVETVAGVGLWSTLVDPHQLENALLNLCINARDAMPEGGILTVETSNRWMDHHAARERDLQPGQYVSMCVSDNGTGMTPDIVERAFDPFFTTKPIGVGTGLGLSMIYGFVRQSGGHVRIYSEVGKGTMVCLYLPRHAAAAEMDEAKSSGLAPAERSQTGETVLVVDDEPLVRMIVVDVLEELGYTALEASDGPSAMTIIQSEDRIDLLVTDVGLPNGMNGRQIAEAARQFRPGLKVLFVTGYAENAVLSHGHLDAGMQVVTKPFDMTALAARIEAMISGA